MRILRQHVCAEHADATLLRQWLQLVVLRGRPTIDLRGVRVTASLMELVLASGRSTARLDVRLDGATIVEPLELGDRVSRLIGRAMTVEASIGLNGANVELIDVTGTRMRGSSLRLAGSHCGDVLLDHVDLSSLDLVGGPAGYDRRTQIDGTLSLRGATVDEVDLRGVRVGAVLDVSGLRATRCLLDDTQLRGTVVVTGSRIETITALRSTFGEVVGSSLDVVRWRALPRAAARPGPAASEPLDPRQPRVNDMLDRFFAEEDRDDAAHRGPRWRPELVPAGVPERELHWMTVEEWVGYTERVRADGTVVREGGVMGLQLAPWPSIDDLGRVRFTMEATWEAPVLASALQVVVRELLGPEANPPVLGSVYAVGWDPRSMRRETPLPAGPLFEVVRGLADISAQAQEVAATASLAALVPLMSSTTADGQLPDDTDDSDEPDDGVDNGIGGLGEGDGGPRPYGAR
ncbi:MAG TPA: hypothetical protein VIT41_09250 [Microlunatus sp.]